MTSDPFAPLRREYLERAAARAWELAAVMERPQPDCQLLRRIAHNLRGSGGFYGFGEISEAAGAMLVRPGEAFD